MGDETGLRSADPTASAEVWEHTVTRLLQVIRARLMHQVADYGITMPQFLCLRAIASHGPECAMTDLAAATHQFSATVTGIVNRLVRDGLVGRRRDSNDRRVVLVCLTPSGVALMQRASAANRALIRGWLTSVGPERAANLLQLLSELLATVEKDTKVTDDVTTSPT